MTFKGDRSILILGGTGRIGQAVAFDLLSHTEAHLTLAGRSQSPSLNVSARVSFLRLDLDQFEAVEAAIQSHQMVIHCAGPFRDRNHHVLQSCMRYGVPYLDVADSPDYIKGAIALHQQAQDSGVIAVVGTGVFPGMSCSMAKSGVEQFEHARDMQLSYLVAGSGGAGVTVMRTTFLELQTSFWAKQDGAWCKIKPYSQREVLEFPHFGQGGVYWFNTVEALTLPHSFPELRTVTTKFGSVPDLYNYLTWLVAQAPEAVLQQKGWIEFLSQVSYRMTQISDRFSGVGIAMRVAVTGQREDETATHLSSFYSPDTAKSAGQGAGMVAQAILDRELQDPGVWSVEQIFPTALFQAAIQRRNIMIDL